VLDGYPHTVTSSVAELAASSDVVGLCLREDSDAIALATDGGLLANMRRGTVLVSHATGPRPLGG
jgi:3-hydroxyisobutyrate dehydrogenase-like beta-hydroxyacid dehydrogenase